ALPADSPLARRERFAISDLAGERLLLLEDGHCLRDQALEVCHLAGANERAGFRASSLETLRHMVAAGVGITLLPVLATQPPVASAPGLRLRRFEAPMPHRRIALLWRESSPLGDLLHELAAAFRDLPADLLSPQGS
ncbi:MAG TPA: LysR substrate-binding domain-containing protein, partial [Gammaproteobacteria bacterium]|nr:LysR substrate-binding domain-containing protein [Gammaproteobacteria bacterium]